MVPISESKFNPDNFPTKDRGPQSPPFRPGDFIRYCVKPGQHPAITKDYQAEGVVALCFDVGDFISRDVVERFEGTDCMIGRTPVARVIFQKANGTYCWLPGPQFAFAEAL